MKFCHIVSTLTLGGGFIFACYLALYGISVITGHSRD